MLVNIEPRNVISDTLTPYGNSQIVKNYENISKLASKLTIRPRIEVVIPVEQVESIYPLGTTDGHSYTVRPRA